MAAEPEATSDGRYVVVDGRRWRATDPAIPAAFRTELVTELMAGRRAVAAEQRMNNPDAESKARARVQNAKVALGERGEPWWEPASEDGRRARLAATILALTQHRGPERSICPSDAARAVGGRAWRSQMDVTREIAFGLAEERLVEITQRGKPATRPGGTLRIRARG